MLKLFQNLAKSSAVKRDAAVRGLTALPALLLASSLFSLPPSLLAADFSGSATMPGGAKVDFQNVAATNWVGGELVLKYTTTTGSHGFTLPGTAIADVLVVGGGGAGGTGDSTASGSAALNHGAGGGGGAGGFVESNDVVFAAGDYSVSVGKGGEPSAAGSKSVGGNGDDSTLIRGDSDVVLRAYGGGGGGGECDGNPGGSGGGGSVEYTTKTIEHVGGVAKDDGAQGFAGGKGTKSKGRTAGGGGGAGGLGENSVTANEGVAGGPGKASSIWNGSDEYYAAGGGSGTRNGSVIGKGGSGIGGDGAGGTDGANPAATKGKDGTGSGGGGGAFLTAGGAGGSGVVIVRISKVIKSPERPVSVTNVYDGVAHQVIAPSAAYEITGKTEGTDAGTYEATATLKPGFTWAGGGNEPVTVTLTIEKTWTKIIDLHLDSWMVGTLEEETPNPTCTVKPDCIVDQTTVAYDYQKRGSGLPTASSWSPSKPTEIGQYWVRATVAEGANNLATNAVSPFAIVDNPANVFSDYVEITIAGYDPTKVLTNYPYRVELKEGDPEGFLYYNLDGTPRAGTTGENLSFTTPEGVPLPYCVGSDGWDVKGTSVLYVQIPLIGKDPQKIRLYWAPREGATVPPYTPDAVWTDLWPTEYSTEGFRPDSDFGVVDVDGTKVDRWTANPTMDTQTWLQTTDPTATGKVTSKGALKSGRGIEYTICDEAETPLDPQLMPTNAGVYKVVFKPTDETGYYPTKKVLDVRVIAPQPYGDLHDGAPTLTLGGRVLIMSGDSADGKPEHMIAWNEGQAWWQERWARNPVALTNDYFNPYWTHEGAHGVSSSYPYLRTGKNHDLHHIVDNGAKTNVIWRLRSVAVGNTFAKDLSLKTTQCYLPWSSTAYGISAYGVVSTNQNDQSEVGQMQILNEIDASVYSPCYTNGIGTLYFDTVNGWNDHGITDNAFRFVVEIATKTLEGLPATDENAGPNLENIGGVSRTDVDIERRWRPVEMTPLYHEPTGFTRQAPTKELTMKVTNGGTTNYFYRICVPIDIDGPVRFRIRRTAKTGTRKDCHILVDNIIVAFPKNDAGVGTYGQYDGAVKPSEKDRAELGWKAATSVPFPSYQGAEAGGIFARAKPWYKANAGSENLKTTFIEVVRLWYRWRYLDQITNDWQHVDLSKRDLGDGTVDFVATEPLALPQREGDVEYWYENFLSLPYYKYYDYSGANAGAGGFGEAKALGTNTLWMVDRAPHLSSMGTNWYFRVRCGASDYETLLAIVKTADGVVHTNAMSLTADHRWRGTFQLPKEDKAGIDVRFAFMNRQTPGATAYERNSADYYLSGVTASLPAVGALDSAGADDWTHIPWDGLTGYVLFQVEDESLGVSIVHADRQDFNGWTDALRPQDHRFVGNSTETSGVSSVKREFSGEIANWYQSVGTNKLWKESFTVAAADMAPGKPWEVNKPFVSAKTPNGLSAGAGQWVPGRFRDTATGMALQMDGTSGYLQFLDAGATPRGLEAVRFGARLAQAISFDAFSYYSGAGLSTLTNYTFTVRGAYDLAERTTFSGNASLSLIAGYQPKIGCYELRVEQDKANNDGEAAGNQQRLTLYRWRYDAEADEMLPTQLSTTTVNSSDYLNTAAEYGNYSALFLSFKVEQSQTVVIGGLTEATSVANLVSGANTKWITKTDTDAKRLKGGAYGLLTANSTGRFVKPEIALNGAISVTSGQYSEPTASVSCQDDLENGNWAIDERRLEYYNDRGNFWGLKAMEPRAQEVVVYTAPGGTENWTKFLSTNVTDYLMRNFTFNLWTTKDDVSVRIATGDATGKRRTDVVIDDFEIRQWRGESWNDPGQASRWTDYDLAYGAPTNFVFTQAWIASNETEHVQYCQLNAKRARTGKSQSIRSPLFDGGEGRGLGLGMISFSWKNAQENANVRLEIATNDVTLTGLKQLTDDERAHWSYVTNFTFAHLSPEERAKGGTCAYYLGLHAQKGVMRLVTDPGLVASVQDSRDSDHFGSIDITGVSCSDEPDLDVFSWWGWNLRTTDEAEMRDLGDYYADTSFAGLAGALNNSVDVDIVDSRDLYTKHLPFIQTPQFAADVVGEVSFKARKYRIGDADTQVVLFGAHRGAATDDQWEKIRTFKVETDTYTTFTHKLLSGETYSAFRFVVTGVGDVEEPKMKDDEAPANPLRVLIDDVVVMEAITAKVAFRNVAAFRGYLDSNTVVPDIMDKSHQPLCKEAFSVQCEVYAAQLASEVDLSNAKVTLWWYVGEKPWGFNSWRDDPKAHHAVLAECDGTNLVFRGSYAAAAAAVIGEEQKPTPVQYMLTVDFRNSDGSKGTSTLKEADWQNPPWYAPVDYNRTHDGFSAYTLLDSVPSGWAWINEVNIYGTEDRWGLNTDEELQFVEIAAPVDADLTGWTVRFLDGQNANNRVVTNVVAKFGVQLPATKDNPLSVASNCTFHVIASPESKGSFDASDGRVDGVWMVENDNNAVSVTRNNRGGVIQKSYPIGIQLVRPSGIVEHELVAVGTNRYESTHEVKNDPEAKVELLDRLCGKGFFYAGQDSGGVPVVGGWSTSVGAMRNNGSPSSVFETNWSNEKLMTPGRINEGQEIEGAPPSPFGSSIRITSVIQSGHLLHTFGEMTEPTNAVSWIIYPKGSETGTNITYYADRWYVPATSVGTPVQAGAPGVWTLEVGKAISNDVTVTANAAPDPDLIEKYGLGPDNRYAEAVVEWLSGGRTLGGEFANPDYAEPGLGDFYDLGGRVVTKLDLTTMYWLDMDPSYPEGVMSLRGGMHAYSPSDPTCNKYVEYPDGSIWTNRLLTVELYMTNTASGETWAPYVLRGEEPGVTSWDYAEPTSTWSWASANFKVTGILVNDLSGSGLGDRSSWKPLRWFVFDGRLVDGKPETKSFDEDYRSVIEISDPYKSVSAWKKWCDEHPGKEWPIWHSWDIDDRLMPVKVELLRPENEL